MAPAALRVVPLAGLVIHAAAAGGAAASSKCYALALSGGGDKGAYEAGVIQGIVARLPAAEARWNVITGISAGSIVASGAALYDLGDERAMGDFLVASVTGFTKADVYKNWFPLGVLQGFRKDGFFDTQPLADSLVRTLGSKTRGNRNITIGATEDATGTLVLFNESEWTSVASWALRVRASAAIPGVFQSVAVDGRVFSDGGCVLGVDVFSAVNRCRDAGFADSDIVVDVVTCDSETKLKAWSPSADDTSLPLLLRGLEATRHNQQMADIFDACQAYPKVNWRYYIEPSQPLPSKGLDFERAQMLEMAQIGRWDAGNATAGGACDVAERHRHSRAAPRTRPSSVVVV